MHGCSVGLQNDIFHIRQVLLLHMCKVVTGSLEVRGLLWPKRSAPSSSKDLRSSFAARPWRLESDKGDVDDENENSGRCRNSEGNPAICSSHHTHLYLHRKEIENAPNSLDDLYHIRV